MRAQTFTWEDLRHPVGCSLHPCAQIADCLLDGAPYCLGCAELVLERAEAVHANPRLRSLLPGLEDR